jgi:hypothetical protein
MQLPPHSLKPALQVKPHMPPVQVAVAFAGAWQAVVQPPQWFTSVVVSMQWPPQQTCVWPQAGPAPHEQAPPVQPSALLGGQLVQTTPPVPHAITDGVWQTPLWQQPFMQDEASHTTTVTQVWEKQTWPDGQQVGAVEVPQIWLLGQQVPPIQAPLWHWSFAVQAAPLASFGTHWPLLVLQ